MAVDTRLLRYFGAVAREGNPTTASGRLYVSQLGLTKQIRKLQKRLKVRFFVRAETGMTLTEAGRNLAERVPPMGFIAIAANTATCAIIAAFQRLRTAWRVDMRQAGWSNPTAGLPDGDVEVALLRLPVPGQERLRVRKWDPRQAPTGMRVLIMATAALSLSACGASSPGPAEVDRAFAEQARQVAAEWRDSETARDWGEGLALADRAIHLPKDWPEAQYFDEPSLMSGGFQLGAELPEGTPPATVSLPDTTIDVEPWDAEEAYDILTDVDGSSGGPDFVVEEIEAGTEPWYTNHGIVELPVWKYTVDGHVEPVVQVAFDVESASRLPRVSAPDTEFTGAAGLDTVEATTLSFDVRASCLTDVRPLVHETDTLILLGGNGTGTGETECPPEYETVGVELEREPGHRVIIDAVNGKVLRFNQIYGA